MTRSVRILFVAGSLGGGGAERRLIDLLVNLDRTKFSPRLYLAYRRGELLAEVPPDVPVDAFWGSETRQTILQRSLAKLRFPSAARALHLRDHLTRHPPDVVMSWSLRSSYEAALARAGSRIPHIAMAVVEPQAELEDAFPRNKLLRRRIAGWTYRSATVVVSNSQMLSDRLAEFYQLPATKIQTWLNARDFQRIDGLAARGPDELPRHGRRVVAVGRLVPQKGFDVLLKAVAQAARSYEPIEVVILGQGPEEGSLRNLATELEIEDHVRFVGFQPNPYSWYRTADVYVSSSRFEGLPNTLIEAIACGVPVIATDCPTGSREVLMDGKLGRLIPVDDVAAMTDALRSVLNALPSAAELAAARQSVEARFGMAAGLQRFEEIVRQVCGQTLGPT